MNYSKRLGKHIADKGLSEKPTKLTEPRFVGFVGARHRGFSRKSGHADIIGKAAASFRRRMAGGERQINVAKRATLSLFRERQTQDRDADGAARASAIISEWEKTYG